MREIKFRAYLKNLKIVVDVEEINFYEKYVYYIDDKEEWQRERLEDVELMQSTGIFDKNGNEIYEGYIVEYGNKRIGIVVWIKMRAGFMINVKYKTVQGFNSVKMAGAINKIVIGNIYENPELL